MVLSSILNSSAATGEHALQGPGRIESCSPGLKSAARSVGAAKLARQSIGAIDFLMTSLLSHGIDSASSDSTFRQSATICGRLFLFVARQISEHSSRKFGGARVISPAGVSRWYWSRC